MHATSRLSGLTELTGVRKVWFSVYILHRLTPEQLSQEWEAHRSFAAAGIPGCLHTPPCPAAATADAGTVDALRDRWPPEHEDGYQNAPAIGWFRDA
jgi:hypothetical protein